MKQLNFVLSASDKVSAVLDNINRKATTVGTDIKNKMEKTFESPRSKIQSTTGRGVGGGGGFLGKVFGKKGGEEGGAMPGLGGASGPLMGIFALTEIVKTGMGFIKKIVDILSEASPLLAGTLKMIYKSLLLFLKPIGDMLAMILMPLAKFLMLWGMAVNKLYTEKFQENIAEGMSPMAASMAAATESFIGGIVGLFTGAIGDIDLGTDLLEIIGSIVDAFIEAVKKPGVMVDLLLIGGAILAATVVGLATAALAFTAAMTAIAWAISAATSLGLIASAPAFTAMGTGIAGTVGAAVTLGLAGLPLLIAGAIVVAWPSIADVIYEKLGLGPNWFGEVPEGGPTGAPPIPGYGNPPIYHPPAGQGVTGGTPITDFTDWITNQPWWPFAEGGIVTGPTLGLVGEREPEAIIPLSRLKDTMGKEKTTSPPIDINVHVHGNIYGIGDIHRAIEEGIDEYSMRLRLA